MIWHFIAAGFAALGAAGIAQYLRILTRKKLPRWIVPVAAGIGLLAYQIHYEYSWFEHKQELIPTTSEVVETRKTSFFWRPWTFAFPMTTSFTVLDTENLKQQQQDEGRVVQYELYRIDREYLDQITPQGWLLNCRTAEALPLTTEGMPRLAAMEQLDRSGVLYRLLCD